MKQARRAFRTAGLDERSWVPFFHADLGAEWVGVYPEIPEPPPERPDE